MNITPDHIFGGYEEPFFREHIQQPIDEVHCPEFNYAVERVLADYNLTWYYDFIDEEEIDEYETSSCRTYFELDEGKYLGGVRLENILAPILRFNVPKRVGDRISRTDYRLILDDLLELKAGEIAK